MSIQNLHTIPHRYDVVGSFLRPERLKEAREKFAKGEIDTAVLKKVEDEEIVELVKKQKAAGLKVITDGEFRRATWHLDFMWGFDGINHKPTETGIPFYDEQALIDDTFLVGKLGLKKEHPFVEHFRFVKALEDEETVAKLTIPSPAQFLEQLIIPINVDSTEEVYSTREEVIQEIARIYHELIVGTDEAGLEQIKEDLLRVNNLAIEGKPEDLVVNTHICRGNFHSTWACTGGYDAVAKTLFARENVNAYFLEFDDERSGGFEPLQAVSGEKKVVLGLITTKSPKLEDKKAVIERIYEAAKYVPLERLYLSPQCGFASCEIGNKLTEKEQWAKIALVKEIAQEVWGKEE